MIPINAPLLHSDLHATHMCTRTYVCTLYVMHIDTFDDYYNNELKIESVMR